MASSESIRSFQEEEENFRDEEEDDDNSNNNNKNLLVIEENDGGLERSLSRRSSIGSDDPEPRLAAPQRHNISSSFINTQQDRPDDPPPRPTTWEQKEYDGLLHDGFHLVQLERARRTRCFLYTLAFVLALGGFLGGIAAAISIRNERKNNSRVVATVSPTASVTMAPIDEFPVNIPPAAPIFLTTNAPTPSPIAPITLAPITPAPITPMPITPMPITPMPITPMPITPMPITPMPFTPAPTTPAPITPAPTPTNIPITPAPIALSTLAPSVADQNAYFENANWTLLASQLTGRNVHDNFGHSLAMSGSGGVILVGANQAGANNQNNSVGYARVYGLHHANGAWEPIGSTLVGDDTSSYYGSDVAISQDAQIIAVGAPEVGGTQNGFVDVLRYETSDWMQLGQRLHGTQPNDGFGASISLSDDGLTLAVGAPYHNHNAGYVYVFRLATTPRNATHNETNVWEPLGQVLPGLNSDAEWGGSVSLAGNGDHLAVGARYHANRGNVAIYRLQGTTWYSAGSVIPTNVTNDLFGFTVDLSRNGLTLAVGAIESDLNEKMGMGSVTVFDYEADRWVVRGRPIPGVTAGDRFGGTLAMSRDGQTLASTSLLLAVGHARVFRFHQGEWRQLSRSLGVADDELGSDVAISNDGRTVAVGSRINDMGHVRVYYLENI